LLKGAISLGVFVTKADGSKQLFGKEKVVRTCLRMGASRQVAFEVAEKVEERLYDGISTQIILRMIFRFMRKYKPEVGHLFDLRKGLSLMSPKPEFELFVQVLLRHNGFEVSPNQVLKGKCVGHEVDAIAKKDGVTYFVEAKHHLSYHSLTGLDESRIARAILEDVSEGSTLGTNDWKIDRAMIVTNTRYSEHAMQYGKCRNILQIGWSSPENLGLQNMIESKKLYPLSCLRGLGSETRMRFVEAGIVLIKQLFSENLYQLATKTKLPQDDLREIAEKAKFTSSAVWQT
jgi:hypothetical protein